MGSLLGTIGIIWGHFRTFGTSLESLLSTIGVIFEHLEFKTSEGDKHVVKVIFLVSYWIAQGPFGLINIRILVIFQHGVKCTRPT